MKSPLPDLYRDTLLFAESAHHGQVIPGTKIPYILHCTLVASEILSLDRQSEPFNLNLAISCALLHDTVEDTMVSLADITHRFGQDVSNGVSALTKNPELPKPERMRNSLDRILTQPKEIGMVKMADRITNLAPPPKHWSLEKCRMYHEEARLILDSLRHCNQSLAIRLEQKIETYRQFC